MTDILLLAGVALCVLSVLLAVIAVASTRPPRLAAFALVLGIALAAVGAWLDPRPLGVETLKQSWERLMNGEISLSTDPVTAPAPVATPEAAETPAPAAPAAETPAAPAPAEAPAAEGNSTSQPSQ